MPTQIYYANVNLSTIEVSNTGNVTGPTPYSGWFPVSAATMQQAAANAVVTVDSNSAVTLENGTVVYKGLSNGCVGLFANAGGAAPVLVRVFIRDLSAAGDYARLNRSMYVQVSRIPGPPTASYATQQYSYYIDPTQVPASISGGGNP